MLGGAACLILRCTLTGLFGLVGILQGFRFQHEQQRLFAEGIDLGIKKAPPNMLDGVFLSAVMFIRQSLH